MEKIVILGNGHGCNTAGKCSPDKQLREYKWAREVVALIAAKLKAAGVHVEVIVPEEWDVSLQERCNRVNRLCAQYGTANCLFISVHANAAGGDGKWKTAGGWCVYTSVGQTKADVLAECLYNAAKVELAKYIERFPVLKAAGAYDKRQVALRSDMSDGDHDYEANFYVLRHTKCAAALTENLFQDNAADVAFLLSTEGKEAIADLHVKGILTYINNK